MTIHRGYVLAASIAVVALAAGAPAAGADEIELRIDGGRVTLIATEVPLPAVLAAWARVGHTRVVGAEALADATVTLHLVDVAEAEALRILLRPAIGYVAAARVARVPGTSRYDRLQILGTGRRPPAARDAAADVRAAPPAGAPSGAPMPLEDLQRLLDAVSGTTGGVAAPDARDDAPAVPAGAGTVRPAPTTPFPGMVVEAGRP